MTFDKGDISNNKEKDWFSYKTGLIFMHGDVFKDGLETLLHLRGALCNNW